jgi:hypothetical protein
MNKVINSPIEDQAMWLTNVQAPLLSNFEKTQRQYKENVDEHWKKQPSFKVKDQVWLQ